MTITGDTKRRGATRTTPFQEPQMNTTQPSTPGYNTHLQIFFQHDRHGSKVAYRWSATQMRAFRMGLADAEAFIAQGQATQISGHPMKAR